MDLNQATTPEHSFMKNMYLYAVSFVALMMIVFSAADLVNTVLRVYIFKQADRNFYSYGTIPCPKVEITASGTQPKVPPCISPEEQKRIDEQNAAAQRERDLVRDISFLIIGIPLFLFHWRIVKKQQ